MSKQLPKEQQNTLPYVLLGMAALLVSCWSLGYRGLWASEGRWAEVTREMLLSRDFFHPAINGLPYFDKPLLTYWLVAATSLFTGGLNEWAVRLPGALSFAVSLALTVWMGRRLWSREVGLTAGWFLLTTYGVLFWARTGTADLENLAATLLAVVWYWSSRERPGFRTFLVFYLIVFIGAQLKGLTAVAVPLAVIAPDVLMQKRWRSYLAPSHFAALALASLVYLAPFLYASMTRPDYHSSGLGLVFQENIQRYFDPIDHVQPFYLYFYELPTLLLPWAPFFIGALAAARPRWKGLAPHTRWLIYAAGLIFLFFSASGSRRSYYIMPIVPFCALWMALYVGRAGGFAAPSREVLFPVLRRLLWGVISLLGLVEAASPLLWPLIKAKTGFAAPAGLPLATAVIGVATLGLLLLDWRRPQLLPRLTGAPPGVAGLLAAAFMLLAGYFCWQTVPLEAYRTERPFALQLKRELKDLPPEQLVFYEKAEPNVLFYLDLPGSPRLIDTPEALHALLTVPHSEFYLVVRRNLLPSLVGLPQLDGLTPSLEEASLSWQPSLKKLAVFHVAGPKHYGRASVCREHAMKWQTI